ncbi:hypothetical protein [Xanthomonas bonasiae]|uniref:hypothetical protein n=1 Tax=Xanthomonas bonasiae TaxID=2810351 RepID=UPI00177C62AD|nr:hypothetical protein [Xanthomonas surreyensis]MBD7923455.1 hypothetical protein [Xanthomonas surreyensis]
MNQDRASYFQIKSWVLENYWDGCRDHGPLPSNKDKEKWNLEQIASDVYDGYAGGEGSFDSPLEYLMLEVISFVLSCWHPVQAEYHKDRICNLLLDNDLEEMIKGIPENEIHEFKHDLSILGFL